jgi:Flp pilus assembly protein TadD
MKGGNGWQGLFDMSSKEEERRGKSTIVGVQRGLKGKTRDRNDPNHQGDMANSDPTKVLERARQLHRSQQHEAALVAYRQYLGLQKEHVEVWVDLGDLALSMGRLDEACEACEQARTLDPGNLRARLVLAESLVKQLDLGRATEVLAEAFRQDPDNPAIRTALEAVLFAPGNPHDLHGEYKRLFGVDPSEKKVWNLACRNLLLGHLRLGWEQYESRWHEASLVMRPRELMLAQPQWTGEPFEGKTLLLRWEQGLGDVIMFVRYAPMVKARGGRVLLEVAEPLVDLLATCPGIDEVLRDGDPVPTFDLQLPLLSLPRIFQTDLHSIPAETPYLSVPERVPHREGIDRILAATGGYLRVGLVWAGNPKHINDAERSIPPTLLKPLEALPVAWHGFQTEPGGELPFPRIIPMGPVVRASFSDTAYALSRMDLVITVDTAVAHLAGALGLPTLLLVTAIPDWRWLMDRTDSPWYPTLRIYRQPEPGNWASVIERLMADLTSSG